ncbi:MAG: 3-oxoacyl-ACP reductase FabG, partial [Armatimonadetes bacterium]|nr:3-oxoacyl-ACP reductase FabG [Armatimonadota bacterium]
SEADSAKAAALAAELPAAIALPADVRELAQVERLAAEVVERLGGFDIWVNNAGILRDRSLHKMTEEDWRAVIDVNLSGVFHGLKTAATHLRERGWGRIVSVSSVAGYLGIWGQTNYSAAKAGVAAMTRVAATELAARGVTVNAVAPGVIDTDMVAQLTESARAELLQGVPMARLGQPAEIAQVIAFLASDAASYVTGQVLHVNGGSYMH